mgnify:CR=1 FL=1
MLTINVLHVYKTSFAQTQGGIEEVLLQLCTATAALGINNRIICLSPDCQEKEIIETACATVYCYPQSFEVASCGFSWELWKDFKRLSSWADVLHYQFPWPFADMLSLMRQDKAKPYIVSYQSDIVRQKLLRVLYQPIMDRFLRRASAVVATSPAYINSSDVLSKLKRKPELIPNGIDDELDGAHYQDEKVALKKIYGADFYLFIGVFRYYKGLMYLLEAAVKTGLPLLVVGGGPQEDEINAYIKQQQATNIHVLGHVSNKQKHALIDLAKALVLPSCERSEAYGMVLLEASRQGVPMISTELGSGTSYINITDETGLVVPPKNIEKLSEAMHYMADNDDIVMQMKGKARYRYEQNFTASLMGQRYLKLYQRC